MFKRDSIYVVFYKHADIDTWRNFRRGLSFMNEKEGYHFYGAIDDVWINDNKELIVADVKSTSKKNFDWNDTWSKYEYPKGYKRQLEMYQWLFRKNGFKVSNIAYLLYFNGLKYESSFDQTLKFESYSIQLECNDDWVEKEVIKAKKLLDSDKIPKGEISCDQCRYINRRSAAIKGL